mgnify:CR=1 FL=1
MTEKLLIRHCAPTLAAMKTGSIFSCVFENAEEMKNFIRRMNKTFRGKGVKTIPLRNRENKMLIYVFRPELLKKDMENDMTCSIMRELGYCCGDVGKCIMRLIERIDEAEVFPHEVGMFLGFPPEDVCGFIQNKAKNFKFAGYWKVYGDEEKARRTFERYKKCSEIYADCFERGFTLEKLTVAEKRTN